MIIVPPDLKKGDTIALVCPAGYMPEEKVQTCINTLHQWGFKTKIGDTIGKQFHYFSGTDEERLQDLQQMLDDPSVNAILCARGGYGLSRIIDAINFKKFFKKVKWVIGYSDITMLHTHLLAKYKIASMHAPMAAAFNDEDVENEYLQSLRKALLGKKLNYICETHSFNRTGNVVAELVGGNLSLLIHTIGTKSEINTRNKILFLEDVGEYLYSVDRMMVQLKRAGKLDKLAGLIIGGFTEMKDTVNPFGQEVYELIADKVKEFMYPVCFDFPVGHTRRNYALKIGLIHRLQVDKNKVRFQH
jgi:muramoyltetrapeptide carboxypeptidase